MSTGLPTPASTQLPWNADTSLVGTVQVIRHKAYYNADVPDPIILQVCHSLPFTNNDADQHWPCLGRKRLILSIVPPLGQAHSVLAGNAQTPTSPRRSSGSK